MIQLIFILGLPVELEDHLDMEDSSQAAPVGGMLLVGDTQQEEGRG